MTDEEMSDAGAWRAPAHGNMRRFPTPEKRR
jgi:hypothetical protein